MDKRPVVSKFLISIAFIIIFIGMLIPYISSRILPLIPIKSYAGKAFVYSIIGSIFLTGSILNVLSLFPERKKWLKGAVKIAAIWLFLPFLLTIIYYRYPALFAYGYHLCSLHLPSEDARLSIEEAYNTASNNPIYGCAAGDFYHEQDNYSKAIYFYGKALENKKEDDPELSFRIGRAYLYRQTEETDLGNAIFYLYDAVEKKPKNAEYNYELARAYYEDSNLSNALIYLNVAIDNSTENAEKAEYYFLRGRTYMAHNSIQLFKTAIDDFDNAISIVKTSPEYYFWRGYAYYKIGNYDSLIKARDDFEKAKILDCNNDTYISYYEYTSYKLVLGGWGDSDGGRLSYTIGEINTGALGNQITFNSVSDGVIGNEKNFVGAKAKSEPVDTWNGNSINVQDGEIYTIRLYVHNNNPKGKESIAEDVRATFILPTTVSKLHKISGCLDCSNAKPTCYWDCVTLLSDEYFYIEYIKGSARYTNSELGTVKISDEVIMSDGVLLGYDKFNGKIPGGYEYHGVVIIDVRVHKSVAAKLSIVARIKGTKGWKEVVEAQIGDEIEYQIGYSNLLSETAQNVMIHDFLPSNVRYIVDSTVLYNINYPDGVGIIEKNDSNVTTAGINIGSYTTNSNAYVRFTGRVVDNTLAEGYNELVNRVDVIVNGVVYTEYISVMVDKNN